MPFNVINKKSGWFSNQDQAEEEAKQAAWREQQANDPISLALTKRLLQMRDERQQLSKEKETSAPIASVSALPVPVKKTKVSKLSAAWSKKTLLRPHPKLQAFQPRASAADISAALVHGHREPLMTEPAFACEAGPSMSSLSSSQVSTSLGRQEGFSASSSGRPTATPLTSVQDLPSEAEDASKASRKSFLE